MASPAAVHARAGRDRRGTPGRSASARPADMRRSGRPWRGSTRHPGDGQGLPGPALSRPHASHAGLSRQRAPDAVIRAQAAEAHRGGHRGHAGCACGSPVRQDAAAARPGRRRCLAVGHRPAAAGSTTAAEPAHSPDMPAGVSRRHAQVAIDLQRAAARLVRVDRNPFASHPLTRTATASAVADARSSAAVPSPSPEGFAPSRAASSISSRGGSPCPMSSPTPARVAHPDRRPARRLDHPAGHHPAGTTACSRPVRR